ncbi:class I glutamine amidotransferase-like protein [Meredithblackwellia eburnea MCA 4105]
MSESKKPHHFALILFPGFQLLDVAGPLDCLNILSLTHPIKLSVLSTTLEPVSTRIPNAATTASKGLFAESWVPTHTFSSPPSEPIDVLFLPGGWGTRVEGQDELKAFLVAKAEEASTVMTVCTGSGLLAQTGLLDGKKATGNKRSWPWTIEQGKGVEWIYKARWVEDDGGKYWTSSGVSAGIDQMLGWISKVWGEEVAQGIANGMEYRWEKDSTKDDFAELYEHQV